MKNVVLHAYGKIMTFQSQVAVPGYLIIQHLILHWGNYFLITLAFIVSHVIINYIYTLAFESEMVLCCDC